MRIVVTVKTNSKIEGVEKHDNSTYIVRVNTPPIEGRANARIIELLSTYFEISKSKIRLLKGVKSKKKTFDVLD